MQQCAARSLPIPNFDRQVKTARGAPLRVNISTLVWEDARRGRRQLSREISGLAGPAAPVSPLSEKGLRILRLFARAKGSAEIARELGSNGKLRTHNRLEAVMHALQRGLT